MTDDQLDTDQIEAGGADANADKAKDNSLTPREVDEEFDRQSAMMQEGKGKPVVLIAAIGIALLIGVVVVSEQLGADTTYGPAVQAVEAELSTHVDGFNGCAFSGVESDQLKLGPDVQVAADSFGVRFGSGYAQRLRKCTPKLDKLSGALEALTVPSELEPPRDAMVGAAKSLSKAWTGYRAYLEQGSFAPAAAAPHTKAIGEAYGSLVDATGALSAAADKALGK